MIPWLLAIAIAGLGWSKAKATAAAAAATPVPAPAPVDVHAMVPANDLPAPVNQNLLANVLPVPRPVTLAPIVPELVGPPVFKPPAPIVPELVGPPEKEPPKFTLRQGVTLAWSPSAGIAYVRSGSGPVGDGGVRGPTAKVQA